MGSTSRDRDGTSCEALVLDSLARWTTLSNEREVASGNVYMCPLSAFLSLSLSLHAGVSKQLNK